MLGTPWQNWVFGILMLIIGDIICLIPGILLFKVVMYVKNKIYLY